MTIEMTMASQPDMHEKPQAQVVCIRCRTEYDPRTVNEGCERCGGLLEVEHPLTWLRGKLTPDLFDARLGSRTFPYNSGVWRYRELIADFPDAAIVSRPEGNTGLYSDARLSAYAGVGDLWLKHEGENPTGSFKDRGMTVGISHAKWIGATKVACASSGNTSAALASYAARAGVEALTFLPDGKVSLGKVSQSLAYGARTIQVAGSFDTALEIVRQVGREHGVYVCNSVNPFRLEGQKSIMFEMLQQLFWETPDWIVVPGGNLGNTSAFGKAFYELRELGIITKMPRIAVIQAAGSNPFYTYYRNGFKDFAAIAPETIATAIRIGNPVNLPKAVRALEWTNGVVEEVTDAQIMDAKAMIDRAGIGCEPAAGSTLAGIKKLVAAGIIGAGERVVGVLTGNILKDSDNTIAYHTGANLYANPPASGTTSLDELLRTL